MELQKLACRPSVVALALGFGLLGGAAEPGESTRVGLDADGVLRRSDFGLSRYVPMISDEITIRITLEAHPE